MHEGSLNPGKRFETVLGALGHVMGEREVGCAWEYHIGFDDCSRSLR